MDVDDPPGKAVQKVRAENQHPPGEHDQIRIERGHDTSEERIVVGANYALPAAGEREQHRRQIGGFGPPQSAASWFVADDHADAGLQIATAHRIENRLQIRSRSGGEDGERFHPASTNRGSAISRRSCLSAKWIASAA